MDTQESLNILNQCIHYLQHATKQEIKQMQKIYKEETAKPQPTKNDITLIDVTKPIR